jgi:hypothetical protein
MLCRARAGTDQCTAGRSRSKAIRTAGIERHSLYPPEPADAVGLASVIDQPPGCTDVISYHMLQTAAHD